ncbi:MAG: hypothetical protein COA79_04980 [Planctomycetota bacterium]|nr:MAG: hypothetical protein COA79_04980 [Planctomycetota bacterium]
MRYCSSSTLSIILIFFILYSLTSCKTNRNSTKQNKVKAIKYIIDHQEQDGAWSVIKQQGNYQNKDGIIAVTSIAIVSLLNNKEPGSSENIRSSIKKGLAYLLRNQTSKGNIGKHNYANGLSFYAISLAITKKIIPPNKSHKKLFINILSKQSGIGAWDYSIANNHRNDLSISAWVALGLAECLKLNDYKKEASQSINKLNQMLRKDQTGAGDNSITTKAGSAYTYGNKPNLNSGKETRKPGSTIQAIVLRIKAINNQTFNISNWVLKAINDQTNKKIKPEKINYYRLFFFTSTLNLTQSSNQNNWKKKTLNTINNSQQKDGSFPLTTINMKFGGKIISTAITLLTINNLNKK